MAVSDAALIGLRSAFLGDVVTPSSPDFDDARRVWNGTVDKRPALVVRPKTIDDVVAAVRFAREHGLEIAVRGGGHSLPGYSTCDDGIVIDLRAISAIEIDPVARTARVGGGALLGDLDRAAQEHAMAVPVGFIGHTGVGGLTLGGGIGVLMRKHGLSIDSLLGVELVTADGRVVRASADEEPELFWGIRGAGANFGIVTSFTFRMHPIGRELNVAALAFAVGDAAAALEALAAYHADAPDDLLLMADMSAADGTLHFSINAIHHGTEEEAAGAIAPLSDRAAPFDTSISRIPYLALQGAGEQVPYRAWGHRNYFKGGYVSAPVAEMADVMRRAIDARPCDLASISLVQLGGAISRVDEDATAFTGRAAPFMLAVETVWTDAAQDDAQRAWTQEWFNAFAPWLLSGNYVNTAPEEGMRATYGPVKYERLRALKRTWDPDNAFRLNGNIAP